jgi:hypothetical protein
MTIEKTNFHDFLYLLLSISFIPNQLIHQVLPQQYVIQQIPPTTTTSSSSYEDFKGTKSNIVHEVNNKAIASGSSYFKNNGDYNTNDNTIKTIKNVNDLYQDVFYSCGTGIALCTMGGTFIDCNEIFLLWSGCSTMDEIILSKKTIFDMMDQKDLHNAFERICQFVVSSLVSSTTSVSKEEGRQQQHQQQIPTSVLVRGKRTLNHEQHYNVRVTLVLSSPSKTTTHHNLSIPKYITLSLVSDPI